MKLIDLIRLLDAIPEAYDDYEVEVSSKSGTYSVVDIKLDKSNHTVVLIDESKPTIDDTVYDAKDRAGKYDRKPGCPTAVERILELS